MINKISDLLVFLLENTETVFHENSISTRYDKTRKKNAKIVEVRDNENTKNDVNCKNNDNDDNDNNNKSNSNNKNNKKKNDKINNNMKSNNIQSFTKLILGIEGLGLRATTHTSDIIENSKHITEKEHITPINNNNDNDNENVHTEIVGDKSEISLFLDLQSKRVIKAILYNNENVKNIISKREINNNNDNNNNNNNDNNNYDNDNNYNDIYNNDNNNNEKEKFKTIGDKIIVRDLGLKFGIESGDHLNGILVGLSGIFGSRSSLSLDDSSSSSSTFSPSFPPFLSSITSHSPILSLSSSSSPPSPLPLSLPLPSSPLPSYLTRQLLLSSHRYCTQDWGTPHTLTKIMKSLSKFRILHQISYTQLSDTISYYKRNLDLIYNDNDIIDILTIFLPFFIKKKNEIPIIDINNNKNFSFDKIFLSGEINEKTKNEMKFIIENFVQKLLNDEKIEINNIEKNVKDNDNENENSNTLNNRNLLLIIETIKVIFLTEKTFENENENENKSETDDMKSSLEITNTESTFSPSSNRSLKTTEKFLIPLNMKSALINGFLRAFYGFDKKELMSILQFFPTVNIFWQDCTVEYGKDGDLEREENNEKLSNIQMKIIEIRNAEKNEISNTELMDKIFSNFGVPNEVKNGKNGNQVHENAENLIIKIEKSSENNPYVRTVKTIYQNISPKYPLFPLWDTLEELRELIPLLDSCSNYIPNVLWQCHKKKITIQALMVNILISFYFIFYLEQKFLLFHS